MILVEEDGPPTATVPGFVVPGDQTLERFPIVGRVVPLAS